ncbi:MAG: hypothetical protein IJY98_07910, partial [Bacteroidaceae bacterium]|nr:hypothetical protein [Bacteroidaceae bacterium]
VSAQKRKQRKTIEQKNSYPSRRGTRNLRENFGGSAKIGSVAKRCGHSPYTIPNILAFDFSVFSLHKGLREVTQLIEKSTCPH